MNLRAVPTWVLVVSASLGLAQVDRCVDFANAMQGVSYRSDSTNSLVTVFDSYCSQSGSLKNSALNFDLSFVTDSLPVDLTGSFTDSKAKMSSFCKNYSSTAANASRSFSYERKFAQSAIKAIETCLQLNSRDGSRVTHEIESIRAITFYISSGDAPNLELRGLTVIPSNGVICRGQIASRNNALTTLGPGTFIRIAKSQNIVCERSPTSTSNGREVFTEQTITLSINTRNYTVYLPPDTRLPIDVASAINTRLSQIEQNQSVIRQNVTTLSNTVRQDRFALRYTFSPTNVPCAPGWIGLGTLAWLVAPNSQQAAFEVDPKARWEDYRLDQPSGGWRWAGPQLCKRQ